MAGGETGHRLITLTAGGTGGHLFPAQSLGEELVRRGFVVHLLSDERVKEHGSRFPAADIQTIPSSTIVVKKPWTWPGSLFKIISGVRKAKRILAVTRPLAVVGFGGYPSLPPLYAARSLGIPIVVHEQNAVMGRANRIFAGWAHTIASSFARIENLDAKLAEKVVMTGNPVRDLVLKAAGKAYTAPTPRQKFRLLVFGGSQGARFFSEFLPEVIKALPQAIVKKMVVVQQCRPEDLDAVKSAYERLGVEHDLQSFFGNLPAEMARAHLVIGRSGASTIAELGVVGRPAVLVPLPHAIDNDQLRNAQSFADAGGGWLMPQAELNASDFAAFLTRLRYQPNELEMAASAASAHGRPQAAQNLADLIEKLTQTRTTST